MPAMKPTEKTYASGFKNYLTALENLNSEKIKDLEIVMCGDIHFVDPFNDVVGLEKVQEIFRHMYRKIKDARFIILNSALDLTSSDPVGLIRWRMEGNLISNSRPWPIEGMSEVRFAVDGRVHEHIDHWDSSAQFFERLTIVGWFIRLIKAGIKVA
jgi:steroid delta-isomerase